MAVICSTCSTVQTNSRDFAFAICPVAEIVLLASIINSIIFFIHPKENFTRYIEADRNCKFRYHPRATAETVFEIHATSGRCKSIVQLLNL